MIPEKHKTYLIDYVSTDPITPQSNKLAISYKGQAIYTGYMEEGEMGKDLFVFDIPGEGNYNLFAEEDIVSEVKETTKEVWNGNSYC